MIHAGLKTVGCDNFPFHHEAHSRLNTSFSNVNYLHRLHELHCILHRGERCHKQGNRGELTLN